MYLRKVFWIGFVVLVVLAQSASAAMADQTALLRTPYRLVEGSTLTVKYASSEFAGEEPLPVIELPIQGRFFLQPVADVPDAEEGFRYFVISELEFRPVGSPERYWGHDGKGRYMLRDASTDPMQQRMMLEMAIDRCAPLYFDSGIVQVPEGIKFPWIDIKLAQVHPDDAAYPRFGLRLVATPWPDVWFSTEESFTSGNLGRRIGDGDLLATTGRVLRTNAQLLDDFEPGGIRDYGLDAVIGPPVFGSSQDIDAKQIWFSTEDDVRTQSPYGLLGHGDLLSDVGRVVRRNEELLGPFSPMPPVLSLGLDAMALKPSADADSVLVFSTEESFYSESLGRWVGHGDLLQADGRIFRTNEQLVRAFDPVAVSADGFGLDAVYVWPHGEIWFSTEVDFYDARWGLVRHGDLLSDSGRVVVRNNRLMAPFEPLEELADFGLDAMWVPDLQDNE
jgi:hypothetical protein